MTKKAIVIFSLILSILSLIYIILDYYGYIRYYQNKMYSTNYYFEKYKQLDRADKDRVIIHFASSARNLNNIKPFLNSLLDQTVKVDEIAVSIPYNEKEKVPKSLKNIISVYPSGKDFKSSNKLAPIILREKDGNTKIIIVEPNIVYGKDFIEELSNKSKKNPNSIIHSSDKKGYLVKSKFFNNKIEQYKPGTTCDKHMKNCTNATYVKLNYNQNYSL